MENTGQKNVVLTVYELLEGEATMSQGRLTCFAFFWSLSNAGMA